MSKTGESQSDYIAPWSARYRVDPAVNLTYALPGIPLQRPSERIPSPPKPPEPRIEYVGFLTRFMGTPSEFERWKLLPLWRRMLT